MNSDKDINNFQRKKKKTDEKKIAKMLNDELRFRQDLNLRYSVSQDCYLYRQRGITNEEHIQNLRLLTFYLPTASDQMLDQRPHLKTFVTFILMENRIQL